MNCFKIDAALTLDSSEYNKGLANAESSANGFASKISTAAKAGGVALAAVGTAAIGAGTALFGAAKNAASYGDSIDKMSQKMGISAEAYQEWDFVMQHAGTSMETLKASMKTLSSAAISGNDAFDKLGISQEAIAQMSQEELFAATIEALQGVTDETERTYLTGQLLGRGATELGALLNMSAEEVSEMRQRVHELGGVMSDEAVKASADYADNVQDLQTAMSGFGRSLSSSLVPGLSTAAKGLAGLFSGDKGAAGEIKTGLNSIMSALTEKLPTFVSVASEILNSLLTVFAENLPLMIGAAVDLIMSLGQGIINNLPLLVEAALQIVTQLATGIADALPELIPTIVSVLMTVVQTLIDNAPMLLDSALALITGLANGLISAIPVLLDRLPEIITNIVNFILGAIPQIIQAGVDLLVSLVAALPDIIKQIVAALPKIIDGIIGALLDNLPLIVQAGIDLFVALIQALPEIITTLCGAIPDIVESLVGAIVDNLPLIIQAGVDLFVSLVENLPTIILEICKAIPQIIEGIVSAIGGLAWKLVEAGGNLIKGLWEGIKGAASWLWDKLKGWASDLLGGILGFFGIHSPSTVFRDMLGKNLMIGFADGINRYGDYGINAMEDWSAKINGAVGFDDIAADYTAVGAGRVQIVQNIYAQAQTPAELFEEAMAKQETAMFLGGDGINV